ncbi:ribonuclease H-like domain-containing protein [Clohesyomyces aquaticus]|uniref:Ribonuclease H-like domain-containing protein n=1 Tax=Clohesyomyces aquaticus TaxID=1231657 RepID=A0A1Y1Z4V3_9PLEO|nr:ribonuclease H-like domain-containing protein [Clohesyomyces aquaticus]
MDVDNVSFPHHLLGILTAISESDFVSLDFELSGIASRARGGPRTKFHKQSIQERYAEIKASAEKYTIIQVGITCAHFDYIKDCYVLRPYNIPISPLIDERLDIEREFAFQGGAVQFLLKNGFDMASPFTKGVQYLSREEAQRAKQMTYDRLEKKAQPEDLILKPEEVDSIAFLRKVRKAIAAWQVTREQSLDISSSVGEKLEPLVPTITNFEKRLVHQLVRAEFPDLVTISRQGYIRIIHYNEEREAENIKKQKQWAKEKIVRQTGFRWIVEALAKGDLHTFDPYFFTKDISGMVVAVELDSMKNKFNRAATRLKDHQPVLVGHNMFTDLVNVYQCFIGPLPATLEEFNEELHKLFPKIVDTKYLATYGCGDINPSASLEEVAEELKTQPLPAITIHGNHSKYTDREALHEAGYDSLLTATIMLRLSTKLHALHAPEPEPTPEPVVMSSPAIIVSSSAVADIESSLASMSVTPSPEAEYAPASKKKKKTRNKKKSKDKSKLAETKFASSNKFAFLSEVEAAFDSAQIIENGNQAPPDSFVFVNGIENNWENEPFVQDTTGWVTPPKRKRRPMEMLPDFDAPSEFWKKYGNTLRVFGTQESVIRIAEWE